MTLIGTRRLRAMNSPWLAQLCSRINALEEAALEEVLMWNGIRCFCVAEGVLYGVAVDGTSSGAQLYARQLFKMNVDDRVVVPGPFHPFDEESEPSILEAERLFVYDGELFLQHGFARCYSVFDKDTLEFDRTMPNPHLVFGSTTRTPIWVTPSGLGGSRNSGNFLVDPADLSITSEAEISGSGLTRDRRMLLETTFPGARYIGPIAGNWYAWRINQSPSITRSIIGNSGTSWPNTNSSTYLGQIGSLAVESGGILRFEVECGHVVSDGSAIFAMHDEDGDASHLGRISTTPGSPATVVADWAFDLEQEGHSGDGRIRSWCYDDGKVYVLCDCASLTRMNAQAIVVLNASTMTEVSRIEGNIRKAYATLTEWFKYGPGEEDDPANKESVGVSPPPNSFRLFDSKPFIMHGGLIRDWRLALEAVCVHYKNAITGNQWIPPGGTGDDPHPDNIYTGAVNNLGFHWWNYSQFSDPPSGIGDRMVKGWPSISFFEVEKIIKVLEGSETP